MLKTSINILPSMFMNLLPTRVLKSDLVRKPLGGHISLVFAKSTQMVESLILAGSSGLYENAMGDSFPRRGDYEYIRTKTEEVFYDPSMATKKLVDHVFKIANKRDSVVRLLAMAKSAIRHNMSKDVPQLNFPCLPNLGKTRWCYSTSCC